MSAAGSFAAPGGFERIDRAAAAGTALWIFIAVVSSLFGLFFAAYVMRLSEAEGYPLALPWQFWLSTALLLAGSLALEAAAAAARAGRDAGLAWRLGGACALAFVAVQLWAWSALGAARVLPQGNPAAGFLYVLTALHGLHVLGGVLAWGRLARRGAGSVPTAWRIALCARYWHFLLLLWFALFATLGLLTPDVARAICGRG
ncbi:bb3-type cytochrome oxidase subunit III [Roseateles violae]|uniref:Bb3-type cytochrome oxidase subunit III n=1 Tax=Roseateles violae TaxID=3058042 RepID=A0ABT8DWF6_9BURK|nr:bb3-type cytochrome oxidase subunit III [Pelomonas sp. PFR6]MDN3921229.1 bb3-type cytochrome oxidase subunit III [Pelomonas sp. PFR6]